MMLSPREGKKYVTNGTHALDEQPRRAGPGAGGASMSIEPGKFYDPESGLDGGLLPEPREPEQEAAPEQPEKPRESGERPRVRDEHGPELDIPPGARTIKNMRDRHRVIE